MAYHSVAKRWQEHAADGHDPTAGIVDDYDHEAPANGVFGRIPDAKIERQAGQEYALDAALAKITRKAGRCRAIVLVERRVRIDGPVESLAQHQPSMGNSQCIVKSSAAGTLHAMVWPQHLRSVRRCNRVGRDASRQTTGARPDANPV